MYGIYNSQGERLYQFGSFVSEMNAYNVLRKARERYPFAGCQVKPIPEKPEETSTRKQ